VRVTGVAIATGGQHSVLHVRIMPHAVRTSLRVPGGGGGGVAVGNSVCGGGRAGGVVVCGGVVARRVLQAGDRGVVDGARLVMSRRQGCKSYKRKHTIID
jgi:hypothetical protein